jgi:hypothetical protein
VSQYGHKAEFAFDHVRIKRIGAQIPIRCTFFFFSVISALLIL